MWASVQWQSPDNAPSPQTPGVVIAVTDTQPSDGSPVDVTNMAPQPQLGWVYDGTSFAAPVELTNLNTLVTKLLNAFQTNQTYLGLSAPTNTQVVAQLASLTRQVSALERLIVNRLDSTIGT